LELSRSDVALFTAPFVARTFRDTSSCRWERCFLGAGIEARLLHGACGC
jgi:hypothetical protein